MAGIKQPLQDILTQLTTLQVINQDKQTVPLFARMWNNQFKRLEAGELEAIPLPSAFVEKLNPDNYTRIGIGFDAADIIFRIHVGHWFVDATDGTFEQDLAIYDLRDRVVALLSDYKPTGCGRMLRIAENQDYDYKRVNVYEIDFKTHFIDSKGSKYDPSSTYFADSTPPTGLEIDIIPVDSIAGERLTNNGQFRIPNNKI